ncbi:MAG: O-antigen ligase family protein [Sulfurovaceae bacterium]|nr:O-antigen ligase family protein [Sulfurovaceae bacterium]
MFKLFSGKTFYLFIIVFVASQIIFPLSNNVYISNLINIFLLIYFSSYLIIKKEIKLSYNYIILAYGVFVLLAYMSFFWTDYMEDSQIISFSLLVILIDLILIYNLIRKFNISESVLYGVVIGNIPNLLIALGIFSYDTGYKYSMVRFVGTAANPNITAIFLLFSLFSSLMLLANIKNSFVKAILSMNLVLTIYTIALTVSKKGILFGVFMILAYYSRYFFTKKFLIVIVSTLALVVMLWGIIKDSAFTDQKFDLIIKRFDEFVYVVSSGNTAGTSTGYRLKFISIGEDLIGDKPLLGYGVGSFSEVSGTGEYAHNNFIEVAVGLGIIGFFIYYSIYFVLFYKLYFCKNKEKYLVVIFVFILLLMDAALVSYSLKLLLIMLLYCYWFVDQHCEGKKCKVK